MVTQPKSAALPQTFSPATPPTPEIQPSDDKARIVQETGLSPDEAWRGARLEFKSVS
jgi:hypothetical protein